MSANTWLAPAIDDRPLMPGQRLPPRLIVVEEGLWVWMDGLEHPAEDIATWEPMLSPEERSRAGRFVFERDRRRFIAGRARLRFCLAALLGSPPESIRLSYQAEGKPELAFPARSIHFNLSHSHGRALYAVATGRRIGVDLEFIRPLPEAESMVQVCCATGEIERWRAIPAPLREEALLDLWTCKEAVLKAIGTGLAVPPNQVEIDLDFPSTPRVIRLPGVAEKGSRWEMRRLRPAVGWVGAMAVESR